MDPRTPVLVGVGEATWRPGEQEPESPPAMMAAVARAAAADAGAGDRLLRRVGAVAAAPSVAWLDADPARRVAERLGFDAALTLRTSFQGGNGPPLLVDALAARIQAGELDAGIACSAEMLATFARHARASTAPPWPDPDPSRPPDVTLEEDRGAGTEAETAVGMIAPITAYPLIENAIAAAAGRSVDEQLDVIADLWARFSAVAARQPAAWSPRAYTAGELRTPGPDNRRVTFPYHKLLNANIQVDQAAAVVLCSVAVARSLGVAVDRWVFPHAIAAATDEWFLSERRELHRSPAIAACGEALFKHARPDGLGPIDLYSCFPSAVQLAASELGLPLDRELTCTGGLTFFGGPGNGYALHGLVAVARRLREAPAGEVGLATGLGWYATKHALGLYGNAPPDRPFASLRPTPAPGARAVAEPIDATARVETCTVVYERDGSPGYGILFALLDDGRRALAKTDAPDLLALMPTDAFRGATVSLRADRTFDVV